MARAMGIDRRRRSMFRSISPTRSSPPTTWTSCTIRWRSRASTSGGWTGSRSPTRNSGVSPTWWLNYVHFTDQAREGKRPLLFHRWGGLGNHRYQIGFSGDTISVWDSLAFQPWFTATAANVGYAYWSHDIGGHMPGVVEPELTRAGFSSGSLARSCAPHHQESDAERRIWAYPEPYSEIMRDLYHRRYAMLPYIYTEARRTYDTGLAFLHPLYYEWPEAGKRTPTKMSTCLARRCSSIRSSRRATR